MSSKKESNKNVTIYRDKRIISSFLGAFGNDLKETRLTSALGYLIAQTPEAFSNLFGLRNEIISINVEEREQTGRVDIKIRTKSETFDLEAKINSIDPLDQSLTYSGKKKILLTNHIPSTKQKKKRNILYINWQDVYNVLATLSRTNSPAIKFLSSEIINYLINHNMIKKDKPTEIYLREINDIVTMNMFMKAHFYCCDFVANSNLYKAIYFAPHFGMTLEKNHAGIECGISHIARIEQLEVVDDWKHFMETLKEKRGQFWINKNKPYLDIIHREWEWVNNRRIVFFLANPIHAFNPPIKKTNLQAGHGWLSKTFLSFDELFKARAEKIY